MNIIIFIFNKIKLTTICGEKSFTFIRKYIKNYVVLKNRIIIINV